MRLVRLVLMGVMLQALPAAGETACTTLACAKCTTICTDTCNAEAKRCEASGKRGCPRAYRSCIKGCPSLLCAQCLPVQYGADDRKFMPGKIELCRTPGTWQKK
jgi:hypothetical protein